MAIVYRCPWLANKIEWKQKIVEVQLAFSAFVFVFVLSWWYENWFILIMNSLSCDQKKKFTVCICMCVFEICPMKKYAIKKQEVGQILKWFTFDGISIS